MWSGLLWSQKPAPKNLSRIGKSYISQQFIERQHQQPTSCTSRKTSSMRACWWLGCKHSVLCLLEFPHAQQTHQSKEPQGSQQSHGLQAARCSWKKNIKLRQHRHQIAKDIFLLASTRSPFLLRHINVVSIRPNTHTAIDISQPPPAATPAPKLHSAHCTLTAVPCSSTQVPKMQTTLWQYPAPAPCSCSGTSKLARFDSSTAKKHSAAAQSSDTQQRQHRQSTARTPLQQQHPEAALCRHPRSAPARQLQNAHSTLTVAPSSGTLQRQQHASSKAHTPL